MFSVIGQVFTDINEDLSYMRLNFKTIIRKICKSFNKGLSPKTAPYFGSYEILAHLHNIIKPKTYLEIGVQSGHSIVHSLKKTLVVGVDPIDKIIYNLPRNTKMFFNTSDKFFAKQNVPKLFKGKPIDFAFIDGMHLFEYVLRDFINTEKFCSEKSVITLHDCIPPDAYISSREFHYGPWTGDVFKIVLILKKYRPDLKIYNYNHVCVVLNLDPKNTVVIDNYDEILNEYMDLTYDDIAHDIVEILSVRNMSQEDTKEELNELIKSLK